MKGYNFKPKANEDKRIIKFLDIQTNFADTFRYLIEKEIAENGVRDLSLFIPSKRNIDFMRESLGIDNDKFLEQEIEILNDESIIIQKKEKRKNKKNNTENLDKVEKTDELLIKDEVINTEIIKESNNTTKIAEQINDDEIPGQINVDDIIKNVNNKIEEEEIEEDEIPVCYQ